MPGIVKYFKGVGMKKLLSLIIGISISIISCTSAPPPGTARFDNFIASTGINSGLLIENLYEYGDAIASIMSKRLVSGRDTIDFAPDSETYIIKYVQEDGGRVFLIPQGDLGNIKDKESYLAVILQYSTEMSAAEVNYSMAFALMFNMAKKLKQDKNAEFPEWIEVGLKMDIKELEIYRKEKFNEDKYILTLK